MPQAQSPEPSLGSILGAIWSHKIVMILSLLLGIGASVGLYLLITPSFEASSSVIVTAGTEAGTGKAGNTVELVTSQARVAESSDVIRDAIGRIGAARLAAKPSLLDGLGGRLRVLVHGSDPVPPIPVTDTDVLAARISHAISVRTEPNSDIIRIAYKNNNPVLAADFTNALTQAFIDRQLNLSAKPGVVDFFRAQRNQFDTEVAGRAKVLQDFARDQALYSIEDQRKLLLQRSSDLAGAIAGSRSALAEKQGQKQALTVQLRLLKPVTQSPFVSTLVDRLGSPARSVASPKATGDHAQVSSDPPLLMVRVYQEAMVALFKVNADLAGIEDMLTQQEKEVAGIRSDLSALAGKEAEFDRLKRDLSLAVYNADLYAKRAVEEQIKSDLRTARLTNLRVIQAATVPLRAVFPNGIQFLIFGVAGGFVVGTALALLLESRKARQAEFVDLVVTSAWVQPSAGLRIREVS